MDDPENLSSTQDLHESSDDWQQSFSLLHPPKFGRYMILRRLGKGGFGDVYLAFDEELDRPVAIKVPRAERVSCPEDVEAYLTEARIVASMDHSHIVPVYDVGRTTTVCASSCPSSSKGATLPPGSRTHAPVFTSRRHWWRRSPKPFITLILVAWSTGTSSPPTF